MWADEAPEFRWYWVAENDDAVIAIDAADSPAASGPAPVLEIPNSDRRLALLVETGGQQLKAFIDLDEDPPAMPSLTNVVVSRVDDVQLSSLEGNALDLDQRLDWSSSESNSFDPGDILRLEAVPSFTDKALRSRWSATSPFGTFFELDLLRTDWIAGEVTIDNSEIEASVPIAKGGLSVLSILLNDSGGTDYRITDLYIGERPDGFDANGRWMTTDIPIPSTASLVAGVLAAEDSATTGLRLQDTQLLTEDDLAATDPYGLQAHGCSGISSEPFDPNWLAEHRCTRTQVVGHSVVMRAK